MGRHKLAPAVSPKKTVEGSLGGLAANGLMAWIFQQTLFTPVSAVELVLLGLIVGVLSQFGDLLESMLKRASGVKDSGILFPGHGGFLDRVDSLLLPAPVVYFLPSILARMSFPVTAPKTIALLGSTGSIGTQVLELVQQFPDRFSICGLVAGRNISLLQKQIEIFRPRWVSVASRRRGRCPSRPPGIGAIPRNGFCGERKDTTKSPPWRKPNWWCRPW